MKRGRTAPHFSAGAAKRSITPERPAWLFGYAHRTGPNESVLADIYVRALALEDCQGQRCCLLSAELAGISGEMATEVKTALGTKFGLPPSACRFAATHTHSAPIIVPPKSRPMCPCMPAAEVGVYTEETAAYARKVTQAAIDAATSAFGSMRPATLSSGRGEGAIGFAWNRRENTEVPVAAEEEEALVAKLRAHGNAEESAGLRDHAVDLLAVRALPTGVDGQPAEGDQEGDGEVIGLVFGYACHCTVMGDSSLSGDWAGFAMGALEEALPPAAVALFVPGCGGDQNPRYRRHASLARLFGEQAAEAVLMMLDPTMGKSRGTMRSIPPTASIHTEAEAMRLPLMGWPTEEELSQQEKEAGTTVCRTLVPPNFDEAAALLAAKKCTAQMKNLLPIIGSAHKEWVALVRGMTRAESIAVPLSLWRIGHLSWVAIGAEPTVAYSHLLRAELARPAGGARGSDGGGEAGRHCWVSGYTDELVSYLPSEKCMMWFGKPSRWADGVEARVALATRELCERCAPCSDA